MPHDSYDLLRRAVKAGQIDPRIALECFLLVKLGLRRAAIVTVPAELPDGDVLGAQVDYEFRSRMAGQARDVKARFNDTIDRRRLSPIAFKTHVLRSSFANNVLSSFSYLAHREITRSLGLEVIESEVRPTIRELYVCRPEDREAVSELLRRRHEIQKETRPKFKASDAVEYYVYPEERDPEHLRTLGALLGYPGCCVEAYVKGRLAAEGQGSEIPEERAAGQLRGTEGLEAAYWVKDFFPCRPDCPEAAAKGEAARAALLLVDPAFASTYEELRRQNLARVREGPKAIREHERWLSRR